MTPPRIVFLTCTFAPRSTPNSLRAVSLASHIVRHGACVRVITLAPEDLAGPTDSNVSAILDPRVEVERVNAGPFRRQLRRSSDRKPAVERLKRVGLGAILIPDPYCDCLPAFLAAGDRAVRRWGASVVLSLGYPWTAHVAAALLATFRRTPWIPDYGDPWSSNPASDLPLPPWRRQLDIRIERMCLRKAFRVIVTTERTRTLYLRLFPFLQGRVEVVRCGYTLQLRPVPDTLHNPRTTERPLQIVHAGRIYRGARSPEPLLRALQCMLQACPSLDKRICVRFIGDVDPLTQQQVKDWHLSRILHVEPWMSRSELESALAQADALLLLANKGGIQVPSKLYEYFALRKPVVALWRDPDDEASHLVRESSAGWAVKDDEMAISQFLQSLIDATAEWPTYKGRIPIEAYSIDAQLHRHWKIIQQLL